MELIKAQVKDTVVSQQVGTNLFRDILDRQYTPCQNEPIEYFIEADDNIRMATLIGWYTTHTSTHGDGTAQQAFMNSGHPKDKIRDLSKEWNQKVGTHSDLMAEYRQFKTFYT